MGQFAPSSHLSSPATLIADRCMDNQSPWQPLLNSPAWWMPAMVCNWLPNREAAPRTTARAHRKTELVRGRNTGIP